MESQTITDEEWIKCHSSDKKECANDSIKSCGRTFYFDENPKQKIICGIDYLCPECSKLPIKDKELKNNCENPLKCGFGWMCNNCKDRLEKWGKKWGLKKSDHNTACTKSGDEDGI
jgi:hypothetical protein